MFDVQCSMFSPPQVPFHRDCSTLLRARALLPALVDLDDEDEDDDEDEESWGFRYPTHRLRFFGGAFLTARLVRIIRITPPMLPTWHYSQNVRFVVPTMRGMETVRIGKRHLFGWEQDRL